MVTLMILFFVVVYIVLAILFVKLIKKFTKRKLYKWLAVVFVILLPTWDVLLGIIVYPFACKFIPKTVIYETAETDGIYYEASLKNNFSLITNEVSFAEDDFEKGFKYIESRITTASRLMDIKKITPIVYRCIPLHREPEKPSYLPIHCEPITKIQSDYLVIAKEIKLGIAGIRFIKIKNRITGKLMAEYNETYIGLLFPFFQWLDWPWWVSSGGHTCPPKSKFMDFQYDVLKPKQ